MGTRSIFIDGRPELFRPELLTFVEAVAGRSAGVEITKMARDVWCDTAAAHRAKCLDLGAVFNGPDLPTPHDMNDRQTMQAVADLLVGSGRDEIE